MCACRVLYCSGAGRGVFTYRWGAAMEISSGALEEEIWDSVRQKGIPFPEAAYGTFDIQVISSVFVSACVNEVAPGR